MWSALRKTNGSRSGDTGRWCHRDPFGRFWFSPLEHLSKLGGRKPSGRIARPAPLSANHLWRMAQEPAASLQQHEACGLRTPHEVFRWKPEQIRNNLTGHSTSHWPVTSDYWKVIMVTHSWAHQQNDSILLAITTKRSGSPKVKGFRPLAVLTWTLKSKAKESNRELFYCVYFKNYMRVVLVFTSYVERTSSRNK